MTYNDDLSQLLEDVVVIYFKIPSSYLTGEKFLKKSKIRIAVCVLTSKTCFFIILPANCNLLFAQPGKTFTWHRAWLFAAKGRIRSWNGL